MAGWWPQRRVGWVHSSIGGATELVTPVAGGLGYALFGVAASDLCGGLGLYCYDLREATSGEDGGVVVVDLGESHLYTANLLEWWCDSVEVRKGNRA
ncbi:hypothetical protein CDL15_Pgr011151 [Punica granatum]|uniref:Uncharacterized protein n=1 Tax=Punica granatum TaxID=22663 RepID=A0A218WZK0_PUNGR|nr:hypothetical protein CDL15_Pgr011151 [Punica granatum]